MKTPAPGGTDGNRQKKLWEERIKNPIPAGRDFRIFRTGKHKMILGIYGLSIEPEILGGEDVLFVAQPPVGKKGT